MMTRKRRNRVLKLAKGYWGAKSKHFKMANEQVMKSLTYGNAQASFALAISVRAVKAALSLTASSASIPINKITTEIGG